MHEREMKVRKASLELETLIIEKAQEADLTDVELLQVLTSAQQGTLKYMLRRERHGDSDTPAGWAKDDD
jgi:hypothetical protein